MALNETEIGSTIRYIPCGEFLHYYEAIEAFVRGQRNAISDLSYFLPHQVRRYNNVGVLYAFMAYLMSEGYGEWPVEDPDAFFGHGTGLSKFDAVVAQSHADDFIEQLDADPDLEARLVEAQRAVIRLSDSLVAMVDAFAPVFVAAWNERAMENDWPTITVDELYDKVVEPPGPYDLYATSLGEALVASRDAKSYADYCYANRFLTDEWSYEL